MEPEAKLHADLVYQIKKRNNWRITEEEIERLKNLNINIDKNMGSEIMVKTLLKKFWKNLKYENKKMFTGKIVKMFHNGRGGIIKRGIVGETHSFHVKHFEEDKKLLKEGLKVNFYLEEWFDKKKNEKKLEPVNIILES